MKKRATKANSILTLLLLMFFVSCFSVSAVLNVDTITRDAMNYGDKFVVSGNINIDKNARSFLYLSLVCEDGKSSTLTTTFMDLKSGQSSSFSQLATIPNSGLLGNCNVQAKLVSGSEILENVNSNVFVVTNDLTGTFDVSVKTSVQLGDLFTLTGAVVKADKTGVDGTAIINFKQNNEVVFFENSDVNGGQVSYKKDLSLIPAGSYTIDVKVQDNLGNFHDYLDAASFDVSDKLVIDSKVDKTVYNPGDALVLAGNIKPFSNSILENLEVEADFEGLKLRDILPDVKFPFNIKYSVPSNMRSGDHNIQITVKDDKGNFGTSNVKFVVKSIPTTLNLILNQSGYVPRENIVFKTRLVDQASDNYDDSVTVKMYNEKGVFEKSKLVSSNSFDFLIVPYMGLPGTWKLTIEGFGLTTEKNFVVLPYKKVETSIREGILYVKNVGNVKYDDYVDIQIGNKVKGRKVVLELNETTFINLNSLFEPAVYDVVSIPTTGQNFTLIKVSEKPSFFSSLIDITGSVVSNLKASSNGLWFVGLFLAVIVGLVLVFKPARKGGYSESQRAKDFRDGQKMLDQLKTKGVRKGPIKNNYEYPEVGRATEEERKDFADRMAKQVASEQERMAKESFSNKWSGEAKDLHNYSNSAAFEKKEEPKKEEPGFGNGLINW